MKHDNVIVSGRAFPARKFVNSDHSHSNKLQDGFSSIKRLIDFAFAILALPLLLGLSVALFLANPIWNPGPVFFRQVRMGRGGKEFKIWKFRTMTGNGGTVRAANAPLDKHRITPLGLLLRRSKLDEVPNILNIFTGDMSLVGPRPDAFGHATEYLAGVPRYSARFGVRPGITGLAQVRGGYADSSRAVKRKAHYDKYYVKNRSLRLEMWIIAATVKVVFSGLGQR